MFFSGTSRWLPKVSKGKIIPAMSFDRGAILTSTGLKTPLTGIWVKQRQHHGCGLKIALPTWSKPFGF